MGTFVSRAGEKLQFALDSFKISVKGKICADFGCSTGGFTDCLLQNGAKKVYSIDTAYGELAWKLRKDSKVVVIERTNALYVALPEKVDFISVDVGWTTQAKILPNVLNNLKPRGRIVSLIKPHYEAGPKMIKGGKLVEEYLPGILSKVKIEINGLGIKIVEIEESPILGEKAKNTEFLALLVKG